MKRSVFSRNKLFSFCMIVFSMLFIAACSSSGGGGGGGVATHGTVIAHVRSGVVINSVRGHLPPDTVKILVSVSGNSAEVDRPVGVDNINATVPDVSVGSATVLVKGLNAAGAITAEGTVTGTVTDGETTEVTVDLVGITSYAYAALETKLNGDPGSAMAAYSLNPTTGVLTLVNSIDLNTGLYGEDVQDPQFTEDGKFAYVVNTSNSLLYAFSINQTTGAITELTASPYIMPTIDESPNIPAIIGNYMYLTYEDSSNLHVFRINATGTLTEVQEIDMSGISTDEYRRVVANRSKNVVYATSEDNFIITYSIQGDGTLVQVGDALAIPPDSVYVATGQLGTPTVHPSGNFVYVNNGDNNNDGTEVRALRVGLDGSLSLLNTVELPPGDIRGPSIDPSGQFLYIANEEDQTISAVKIGWGGNIALVGNYSVPQDYDGVDYWDADPNVVTFDAVGNFLYVGKDETWTIGAYRINPVTGVLTELSTSPFTTAPTSGSHGPFPTLDPSGNFNVVFNEDDSTDNILSFFINPTTGELTQQGSSLSTGATGPHMTHLRPVRY